MDLCGVQAETHFLVQLSIISLTDFLCDDNVDFDMVLLLDFFYC